MRAISIPSERKSPFTQWLEAKNVVFTSIMDESVSNIQVLYILQAFLSGTLLVCSSFINPLAAVVLLCWFAVSILQCRKGGLK